MIASRSSLMVALALFGVGCSDDDAPRPSSVAGEHYVVGSVVTTTDTEQHTYLGVVSSLDDGATFDLSQAREIAGGELFGKPGSRYVFTTSWEEPTLVRWEVSEDGQLEQRETLSLSNLGLADTYGAAKSLFLSDERAYFAASAIGELVVWNPEKMELIGTVPIGLELPGGFYPDIGHDLMLHDGKILTTVNYINLSDWTVFGDYVRVVAVDPETDEVVSDTVDDRCNYVLASGQTSDGTTYYSAPSWLVPMRDLRGEGFGADSCALRANPRRSQLDAEFQLDLAGMAGDRPAGDFVLVSDDRAFFRVWHPELVSEATPENWDDVRHEAGYRWWTWRVDATEATEVEQQRTGFDDTVLWRIDSRVYATTFAEDFSSTTLTELREDGTLRDGLTIPGAISGFVHSR